MSEEKQKFGKMKFTGYACYAFAAVLTILVVFGAIPEERIPVTVSLISTWLLTGTGLLFGNSAKRIGGQVVQNKTGGDK